MMASLAQWIEQHISNVWVAGSIPARGTCQGVDCLLAFLSPDFLGVAGISISLNEAQRFLDILRKHRALAEDALQTLIEEKAWEPLGYATFREMWQEEIAEFVELNSLIRAVILFEMIDEANEELGHADQLLDTSPDFVQAVKDA